MQAPRGTQDITPADTPKWRWLENTARRTAARFGFEELRVPTFESVDLFRRGVGDTTDVVQKEMFTFKHGDHAYALRPEGTAGTVRAILQDGLAAGPLPLKLYYLLSCFRGENPQAGRLREFHQFGVELFGAASPAADVELIELARAVLSALGVDGLRLEINSIGCPDCRARFHEALIAYFRAREAELCNDCKNRLTRNPLRILDCKVPACKAIAKEAPAVLDYLCDDCRAHFAGVQAGLRAAGIAFAVNPSTVRGLDYYTRTVFEFIDEEQDLTVCGGGRYDGLVERLGGPQMPGLGFGMGLERLLILLEKRGAAFPPAPRGDIYLAPMGEAAGAKTAELVRALRGAGLAADTDLIGRSVKAQMKFADKKGYRLTAVVGESELEAGAVKLRNMRGDGEWEAPLEPQAFADAVKQAVGRITEGE